MLGDSLNRDYSEELASFEDFAEPELREALAELEIPRGAAILDLGCGTGGVLRLLGTTDRRVVGLDLSWPHARTASARAPNAGVVVADLRAPPFREASFDLIWSCNSINHVADPASALRRASASLKSGGHVAVAQSHLLPEMFFAWDYHFDARVRAACHAYYRKKYHLSEGDTGAVTRLLGVVRDAGFIDVHPTTYTIERWWPLADNDRRYFIALFESFWGEKLRSFLGPDEWAWLRELCDPHSPEFCLDRPDFHHIQTLTMAVGRRP